MILIQHLPPSKTVTSLRSEALTLYLADICCADKPLQEIALSAYGDLSEQARAFSDVADMLFMLGDNTGAIHWSEDLAQDQPQFIITNWQPRFHDWGMFLSYHGCSLII